MPKTTKQLFDEQGNLIIRPYRMMDLAAIYELNRNICAGKQQT
jgi:hypothetical protein